MLANTFFHPKVYKTLSSKKSKGKVFSMNESCKKNKNRILGE